MTVSRMERGDGLTINIPPAPFKGGDGMVSRTERDDGQQDGEMGWSVGWGDGMVCKLNIPPAPFKGGDGTVSIHEKLLGVP